MLEFAAVAHRAAREARDEAIAGVHEAAERVRGAGDLLRQEVVGACVRKGTIVFFRRAYG